MLEFFCGFQPDFKLTRSLCLNCWLENVDAVLRTQQRSIGGFGRGGMWQKIMSASKSITNTITNGFPTSQSQQSIRSLSN
jgi:hypothetical protein